MVRDLSEEGRRVVEALVQAPVAWQSPLELARTLERDLEETTDILVMLDLAGWLSSWERDRDVVVTLSVAGASSLGLKLIESGRDSVLRWASQGDPDPPSPRASGVFRDARAAALDRVVDPSGTAEEALERAETASIRRRSIPLDPRIKVVVENLPKPTLLIGLGLTPWPGPGAGRDRSCPSCGSKRLQPSMYCLYCDGWGFDHLLLDNPAATPDPIIEPGDQAHRRELEHQTRKARRKARLLAQTRAEREAKRDKKRRGSA